jgi:type III secretion protein T
MDTLGQTLEAFLQRYEALFLAITLATARMAGLLSQFPLFTTTQIQGQIRAALAVAVGLPVAFKIEPEIAAVLPSAGFWLIAVFAKEFLIGMALGIVLGVPFYGVQAAGDIIDHERGASQPNQTDPINSAEQSTTGIILLLAGLAIFVVSGGLFLIVQVVYDSYIFWPATSLAPSLGFETLSVLGRILSLILQIGVIVAGPAMILMFLVDIVLAFGSKAAKGIELNDFSVSLKNLVVAFALPLYGIFLVQYVRGDWRAMTAFVRGFLGLPPDG